MHMLMHIHILLSFAYIIKNPRDSQNYTIKRSIVWYKVYAHETFTRTTLSLCVVYNYCYQIITRRLRELNTKFD